MLLRDRKTPRAKWHDYKGGEYFVTICTKDRVHFFGEVYGGEMRMTSIGKMLKQEIEKTEKIRGGEVSIPLYVIMPNHVHLIVVVSCRDASHASSASHASGSGAKMDACDASLLCCIPNFFRVFFRKWRIFPKKASDIDIILEWM